MEAADRDFIQGMRYLSAAKRCEEWAGDANTESQLSRLAQVYRARGCSLMLGENLGTTAGTGIAAAPLLDDFGNVEQTRTPRVGS